MTHGVSAVVVTARCFQRHRLYVAGQRSACLRVLLIVTVLQVGLCTALAYVRMLYAIAKLRVANCGVYIGAQSF